MADPFHKIKVKSLRTPCVIRDVGSIGLSKNTNANHINREYLPLKKLSLHRDQSLKKNKLEDLSHNQSQIEEIIENTSNNVNRPSNIQIKKDKVKLLHKINSKPNLYPK